jgi:arylsulfatase A-like enzyme
MEKRIGVSLLTAVLIFVGMFVCSRSNGAEVPPRPNILFVLADDMRWDTIGELGNPEIKTPHLDRLVERGLQFTNAYCMGAMISAVCTPSRTMLLTGRSLWRIPENPGSLKAPPGVPFLPGVLREAGYATFHCGKMGNSCQAAHAAFEVNDEMTGRTADSATENAEHAIAFLRKHDGKRPFFMYLAPPVPHDPRLAPARFAAMYDPKKISLAKNFMAAHPFDNGDLQTRDERLAAHPRSADEMRRHLADYYATISHLDHEVGRVLAEIEVRGWGNTIVIFSADQGLAVGGRHGLMGKQNLYEHVKPPLVFAGPGIRHGKSEALVYLFDLFPTICELAGAPTPKVVEGKSLVGILHGREEKVRDSLFCAYKDCQRMMRDERFKLLEYKAAGVRNVQLFDLSRDPDELDNRADDPKFAGERKRLQALLQRARRQFGDPVDF